MKALQIIGVLFILGSVIIMGIRETKKKAQGQIYYERQRAIEKQMRQMEHRKELINNHHWYLRNRFGYELPVVNK